MSLAATVQITDQDIRSVSTTQGGELLGQIASTADGRTFAYGKNGTGSGTAIAPGKVCQGTLAVANDTNRTGVTAAAGAKSITFTLGGATTANLYQQGYLLVNAGTGVGQILLVSGNTAGTTTTVTLKDAIITATSVTDSKFSLVPNPWSANILTAQGSSTAVFATGVPSVSIPDANYGWFQVGGPASVLSDASPAAVGQSVIISAATAGAVSIDTSTNLNPKVGYALVTGVSTEYRQVFLTVNNG